MRRTKKEIGKVKLRIVELKKQGKNYEQIRRVTGAGYNTISRVVKGFKGRITKNNTNKFIGYQAFFENCRFSSTQSFSLATV